MAQKYYLHKFTNYIHFVTKPKGSQKNGEKNEDRAKSKKKTNITNLTKQKNF